MDVCQRCSPVADYFGCLFVVLTASSVEVQHQVISAGPASRILLKKCGYWMWLLTYMCIELNPAILVHGWIASGKYRGYFLAHNKYASVTECWICCIVVYSVSVLRSKDLIHTKRWVALTLVYFVLLKCMEDEVEGSRSICRQTGPGEVVEKDCQAHKLNKEDAVDGGSW